jgi:tetratricopeptide (TPR) repeat protein
MTKAGILALLAVTLAAGADDQQAALERKAKSSFDRAMASAQPQLGETIECVQDQAALLPVASRDDTPLVYYRKGYCALIAAAVTESAAGFRDAAAAFDQAVSTWPGRVHPVKGMAPETGPSVLMALSGIARLEAGAEDGGTRDDMVVGVARNTCSPELMAAGACQAVFRIGREWLGWMALRHDEVGEAARYLADQPDSFWTHWAKGKRAFADGRFRDAAIEYGASLELWRNRQARSRGDWMARLGPRPQMAAALTDLGGARLLAGETAAAIAALDAALDAEPRNARACFLRARAKEMAGQAEAASADYNLAVRTAFAGAEDLVSGEARLYRGILLYRRKDYPRAEDEFSSALNAGVPADMRADAVAWRHMAAVAGGACSVSLRLLSESLAAVSPYFPKTDARAAMASCPGAL